MIGTRVEQVRNCKHSQRRGQRQRQSNDMETCKGSSHSNGTEGQIAGKVAENVYLQWVVGGHGLSAGAVEMNIVSITRLDGGLPLMQELHVLP